MKHSKLAIAIAATAFSAAVVAEEAAEQTWEATSELGYVMTDGNSDTETLNAKFSGSTSYNDWTHSLTLEAMNASSNDVRSSEKYLAQAQSDYKISKRSYALGVVTWEKDRFGSFDHSTSIALGAGFKAIDNDEMKLKFELAPGYRKIVDHNGNDEEDAIVRAAESFSWKFSETSKLTQTLNTESGDSNTITRFGIGLTSQVSGDLSMKLGHNIKHNSDVPAGTKSVDRETVVTLVYKH